MAKVVITLEDDEDGTVDLQVDFDPPLPDIARIEAGSADVTSAQASALSMIASMAEFIVNATGASDDA